MKRWCTPEAMSKVALFPLGMSGCVTVERKCTSHQQGLHTQK